MKKYLLFLVLGLSFQEAFSAQFFRRFPFGALRGHRSLHGKAPENQQQKEWADRMVDSVFIAGIVGFGVNAFYNKITNDGELARIERDLAETKELVSKIREDQIRQMAAEEAHRQLGGEKVSSAANIEMLRRILERPSCSLSYPVFSSERSGRPLLFCPVILSHDVQLETILTPQTAGQAGSEEQK